MEKKNYYNLTANVLTPETFQEFINSIPKQVEATQKAVKKHIKNCKGELTGDLLVLWSQRCPKCHSALIKELQKLGIKRDK